MDAMDDYVYILYLIRPPFVVSNDTSTIIKISNAKNYGDSIEKPLSVLITDNWTTGHKKLQPVKV